MDGFQGFYCDDNKNDGSTSMGVKNSYNADMDALINMELNYDEFDFESLCAPPDSILPSILLELPTECKNTELNDCSNETQHEIIKPNTNENINQDIRDVNKKHSNLKKSNSNRRISVNSQRPSVPTAKVKPVTKGNTLSNIEIFEHTPGKYTKCFLNLPYLQADECYICLKIGTDFSDVYVGCWRRRVEYHLLVKIIGYAQNQNKNIKISYLNSELCIYAVPGDTRNIYFGPYKIDGAIDLTLFQAIDGRLLLREDYFEKYVKEPKDRTHAFKIVNKDNLRVNETAKPRESTKQEFKNKSVMKRHTANDSSKYSVSQSSEQVNTEVFPATVAVTIEPKLEGSLVHANPTYIASTHRIQPDITSENVGLGQKRPNMASEAISNNKTKRMVEIKSRTNTPDVMIKSKCSKTERNSTAMTGDNLNSFQQVVDDLMSNFESGFIICDILQLGRFDATRNIYGHIFYKKPATNELEIVHVENINQTFTDYIKSLVLAIIPENFNFNWRFETNPDIARLYKVHNRSHFNQGMVLEVFSSQLYPKVKVSEHKDTPRNSCKSTNNKMK